MDPGDESGETATLDLSRATGLSLGRTDVNGERPSQRCPTSEQWQPSVLPNPTSVPRNGEKLALKPMMGHRKKYVSKSFIRSKRETFGCSEHKRSFIATRVRASKEARPCGSARNGATRPQAGTTRNADYLSFPAEAEMKAVDPDKCLDMDDSDSLTETLLS